MLQNTILCVSVVVALVGAAGLFFKLRKSGWKAMLSDASPVLFLAGCLGIAICTSLNYQLGKKEAIRPSGIGLPTKISVTAKPQMTVSNDDEQQAREAGSLDSVETATLDSSEQQVYEAAAALDSDAHVTTIDSPVDVHKSLDTFSITVDYTRSLEEMVKAGKYNYVHEEISARHFPIEGNGTIETEVILVRFYRGVQNDEAIKKMEHMGLVPVKIEHLLALDAQHPDLPREDPIVCLGSVWVSRHGYHNFPYLGDWGGERGLCLDWDDDGWGGDCWFAAFRK